MFHPRCAATRLGGLVGTLLTFAVVVDGRDCDTSDVFSNEDYTSAKIPEGCTTLNLVSDDIGDTETIALADVLKSNTALATLWLDSNKIGNTGAIALAEALKSNSTALTSLHLSYNKIGNTGAIALAEALKSNTALTYLNLNWNNIRGHQLGDRGVYALTMATKNKARFDLLLSVSQTCNNHGTAQEDGTCTCTGGFSGDVCQTNVGRIAGGIFGGAILFHAVLHGIYDGYIKPYLTKRRTYRAFGRAHSIIISTLAGDTYTLTDWGLCKDLKVALCKLAPADAIGKPATFQLLGDLDVASSDSHSSNQKMINTKYGSDDRERMMQAKYRFNFEFALVYQRGEVGERGVGGAGGTGGMGGAATHVYDVTGNAPMRMGSSTAV